MFWRQAEPAGRRREGLGDGAAPRPVVHLRQDVLVVQHVQRGRVVGDAAADLPRRRPEDPGHLLVTLPTSATRLVAELGRFRSSISGGRRPDSDRASGSPTRRWRWTEWHSPTLLLVYLPHLDYDLQRFGASDPRTRGQTSRRSMRLRPADRGTAARAGAGHRALGVRARPTCAGRCTSTACCARPGWLARPRRARHRRARPGRQRGLRGGGSSGGARLRARAARRSRR